MENIIFIWDNKPTNYVKVCLESLRLYNKSCNIFFFYKDINIKHEYKKFKINFIKIDEKECKNKFQYYKVLITKKIMNTLNYNDKLLILDCDLLFQNDPFILFNDKADFYYTYSILSTKDSLRQEKIWKSVNYRVNGGVWGLIVNENSKKLMDFFLDNLLNNTWEKWKNYKPHIEHGELNLNWWIDQDFLNCLDNHFKDLPKDISSNLKIKAQSYKFNYFTSTWGYYNKHLEMGEKVGNKDYVIIHFKANFKDTYNLNNPKIYNLQNILGKKDLTTKQSRDNIYKKFMSRGEKRFHVL